MKKPEAFDYDGFFVYENRKISYRITDNYKPIKNEKMSCFINFFENKENLGVYAIYGDVEEMTNITSEVAKKWFDKYIKNK